MAPTRPRDPNALGKLIVDIATGQKPDRHPTPEEQGKDPSAVALGRLGGKARAEAIRWIRCEAVVWLWQRREQVKMKEVAN
jgi:hypothetical protein